MTENKTIHLRQEDIHAETDVPQSESGYWLRKYYILRNEVFRIADDPNTKTIDNTIAEVVSVNVMPKR